MALPGTELTDVTTPDGRTLRVPQNVLSMLQMPTPAPSVQAPLAMPMPQPGPIDVPAEPVTSGLQAPPEESQLAPVPSAPPVNDSVGSEGDVAKTVDNRPATVDKSNAAVAKQQQARAAQAATPHGQMNAAAGAQTQAIANEGNAVVDAADVDAAGLSLQADVYKRRNEEISALETKRASDLAALQVAEEKKAAELGSLRKKIAGTKIDRSADHPILAAISVALFELGSAMKGDTPGMGVEMLYKALDRKAAAQMADVDQMSKVYGLTKDELETMREGSKRKLEMHNIMIAGESDKAIRQIEEMSSRTNSEKVKANAKILVAQLQQRAGDKSMEALRWGLDYDQKDRAEKNQNSRFYSGLRQADRHHAEDAQLKREDMYLDYQKSLAASKAKGDETEMKFKLELIGENEKRGIGNVGSGQPLLSQKGVDMMKQADSMTEEAKKLREFDAQSPDPNARKMAETRAKALEEKASQVRGDAYIYGQFRARDPVEARELSKKYGASQSVMTLVDDIKGIQEDSGRRYLSTSDKQAAIQSKLGELSVALKDAWQLGAWDKGSAKLVSDITGGDPTKGWDVGNVAHLMGAKLGTDPNAFRAKLDSIASGLETDMYNQMRAAKWDVKEPEQLFSRKREPKDTPERQAVKDIQKDKTPREASDSAAKQGEGFAGPIYTGVQKVFYGTSPAEQSDKAMENQSTEYPGLSVKQGDRMGKLLNAYKGGNAQVGDALLTQALDSSRPDLQIQTMKILRDNAPELYSKARQALPGDSKATQQLDYEDKNRLSVTDIPVSMLVMQANVGDNEAFKELSRRASAKDPEAKKVFVDVVRARQSRRDPLGISTGGK